MVKCFYFVCQNGDLLSAFEQPSEAFSYIQDRWLRTWNSCCASLGYRKEQPLSESMLEQINDQTVEMVGSLYRFAVRLPEQEVDGSSLLSSWLEGPSIRTETGDFFEREELLWFAAAEISRRKSERSI